MTHLSQGDTIKIVITDGDGNVWSSHTIAGEDNTMLRDIVATASVAVDCADHPDTGAIFGDIRVAARHVLGHWSSNSFVQNPALSHTQAWDIFVADVTEKERPRRPLMHDHVLSITPDGVDWIGWDRPLGSVVAQTGTHIVVKWPSYSYWIGNNNTARGYAPVERVVYLINSTDIEKDSEGRRLIHPRLVCTPLIRWEGRG